MRDDGGRKAALLNYVMVKKSPPFKAGVLHGFVPETKKVDEHSGIAPTESG
jgi:hypothetical protein